MELWQKLHKIADKAAANLQKNLILAITKHQDVISTAAVSSAIATGNISHAWKAIKWEQLMNKEFDPLIRNALADVVEASGSAALTDMFNIRMSFDIENPLVYDFVDTETGKLITHVTEQTRAGVQSIVREAFMAGAAPLGAPREKIFTNLEQAANIKESLGLNQRQMGALNKYRQNLRRQGVPPATYSKLVNQFKYNQLQYRAEMIARTEMIQAASQGQRIAWETSVISGDIDPTKWEIEWLITPDDVLCKRCRTMKGKRRPIQGVYTAGVGVGTNGPTLHPNCRCSERMVAKRGAKIFGKKPGMTPPTPITPPVAVPAATSEEEYTPSFLTPMPSDVEKYAEASSGMEKKFLEGIKKDSPWEADAVSLKKHVQARLTNRIKKNPHFEDFMYTARYFSDSTNADSAIRNAVANWAGTSGDRDPYAVLLQEAAKQEFNLANAMMSHLQPRVNLRTLHGFDFDRAMRGARAFLREMYNETQAWLKAENIKEVTAYRGMYWHSSSVPDEVKKLVGETGEAVVHAQPMSSYSTDIRTASEFAHGDVVSVMVTKIPAKRLIGCPKTGFGCFDEMEFVALGGKDKVMMTVALDEVDYYDAINNLRMKLRQKLNKIMKAGQ